MDKINKEICNYFLAIIYFALFTPSPFSSAPELSPPAR